MHTSSSHDVLPTLCSDTLIPRAHDDMTRSSYLCACALAGLAAFSNRIDVCPWTQAQPEGGQLSARLVGGTATYFSPEQAWLKGALGKVKQDDEQGYIEFKRHWMLTPCTSDLFQAAKTVLEMHARPNKAMKKSWQFSPLELARQCASRTPAAELSLMSPTDAESWIVDTLKLTQFAGRITENELGGSHLLSFCSMSLKEQNALIKVCLLSPSVPLPPRIVASPDRIVNSSEPFIRLMQHMIASGERRKRCHGDEKRAWCSDCTTGRCHPSTLRARAKASFFWCRVGGKGLFWHGEVARIMRRGLYACRSPRRSQGAAAKCQ